MLDRVRESGEVDEARFAEVVGRISFFVNAGMRFVTELAKMRAFVELCDEITRYRFGVKDPSMRRFRYGVQVNSLGLTLNPREAGLLFYVVSAAKNFGEAWTLFARYCRIVNESARLRAHRASFCGSRSVWSGSPPTTLSMLTTLPGHKRRRWSVRFALHRLIWTPR